MLTVNAASGFGSGVSAGAATVTYEDQDGTEANLTAYTHSVASGTAAARKLVVGVMATKGTSGATVSSITIDGNTMTEDIFGDDGINYGYSGLFHYDDASTVSGDVDIVVTYSAGMLKASAALWSVFGAASGGAATTDSDSTSTHDLSLNAAAGSVTICTAHGLAAAAAWSGECVEDFDAASPYHSGASSENATALTPLTTTMTGQNAIASAATYNAA